jgi:hypothetical protein
MAGRNLAGTKNPDDYLLGRGKAFFAPLDSNGLPRAFRFLGNVAEFVLNVTTEELKHYDTTEGTKNLDKEISISQEVNITNLTLEEMNHQNLAELFLAGDSTTRTNKGDIGVISPSANLTVTDQGRHYQLFDTDTGRPAADILANRIYDIGTVSIVPNGGGSALVAGTDYTVDSTMGMIFVINGGNMTAGDYDVTIAANSGAATTLDLGRALKNSGVSGCLLFISYNAADEGHLQEWNFHKVTLKAEGDLALIGDEIAGMQLSGAAEQSTASDANSPTLTVVTFEGGVAQ